jgi:hypothetical protein
MPDRLLGSSIESNACCQGGELNSFCRTTWRLPAMVLPYPVLHVSYDVCHLAVRASLPTCQGSTVPLADLSAPAAISVTTSVHAVE